MKILCISDQIDPRIYSEQINSLYSDVDFVLAAGDLPMEYLDFVANRLGKPLYFIFGAHSLKAFPTYHKGGTQKQSLKSEYGTYIDLKTVNEGGLLITGVSGAKQTKTGENQFSESTMKWKLFKLLPKLILNKLRYGRFLDILVTYSPPSDSPEPNVAGYKCFADFIRKFKPRYALHGQIHLYNGQERKTQLHSTEVINVFSQYTLEI